MPFRTGPQMPIGNGSTLTLLGVRPMQQSTANDFYREPYGTWVELIAHFEAENASPNMDRATLTKHHARAFWKSQCIRAHNNDSFHVLTHHNKQWVRVTFTDAVQGELLVDPRKYLRAQASKCKKVWEMIEYASFGGSSTNRILSINDSVGTQPHLPIQPCDVDRQIQGKNKQRTSDGYGKIVLGFKDEAEQVAKNILVTCIHRDFWSGFNPGSIAKSGIAVDYFLRGLTQLISDGFIIQQGGSPYELEIRESFVVRCWEAAVKL